MSIDIISIRTWNRSIWVIKDNVQLWFCTDCKLLNLFHSFSHSIKHILLLSELRTGVSNSIFYHRTSTLLTLLASPTIHWSIGADLAPLIRQFITEKNTLVRGLAHPAVFAGPQGGGGQQMSLFTKFGAVSVSPTNIFEVPHTLYFTLHTACINDGVSVLLAYKRRLQLKSKIKHTA